MDRPPGRDRARARALLIAMVLAASACAPAASTSPPSSPSGTSDPGPSTAPPSTAGGGTLSFGVEGDIFSMDPAICYDTNCWPPVSMLFDALIGYAPNSTVLEPRLAAEMPTVSADGLTYTIKLRSGVTFTKRDGQPLREMTSADVVYSLNRLLDQRLTPTPSPIGGAFFAIIEGADAVLAGTSETASGLKAVDERTVEITLTEPNRAFLNILAMQFGSVVPAELAGADTTAFSNDPIGTGPYYLESYERGVKAVFKRNTSYWREGWPKTDTIEYRLGIDQNSQLQQVQLGQLDIMGNDIPSGSYSAIVNDPALKDQIRVLEIVATQFLITDSSGPDPALSNVKVRQAIAHAIDKENVIRVANGRGVPATCIYPPQMPGYDPGCDPYPRDLARAKALMKEAGFESGFSTKLYTDTTDLSKSIAESLAQDLAQIGIDAEVVLQEFDVLVGTITTPHAAPLTFIGWIQDFPDPSDFYDPILSCAVNVPGGASHGWYCNEASDALAAAARGEPDDAKRLEMYREIQDLVMADVPSIPVYHNRQVGLVSKRVVGDPFHPVYYFDLASVDVTE